MFSLIDTLKGQKKHKEDIITRCVQCLRRRGTLTHDLKVMTQTLHAVHGMHQCVAAKYSPVHLESQKTPGDLSVPVNRKTLLR